jgi:hypothetical protein
MIADLPEPAQRYFRFTIAQGTPLLPVVELSMTGIRGERARDGPPRAEPSGRTSNGQYLSFAV